MKYTMNLQKPIDRKEFNNNAGYSTELSFQMFKKLSVPLEKQLFFKVYTGLYWQLCDQLYNELTKTN
jgi:hypothetical protein